MKITDAKFFSKNLAQIPDNAPVMSSVLQANIKKILRSVENQASIHQNAGQTL